MWVFLGMETIANIKYRSHVDSDSCLLAVCRWLIPHEVAPQQSFTMLQPANAKVIIKNGTTKNNHIYFILQFDPLKHSINNSSCNLTYTPKNTASALLTNEAEAVEKSICRIDYSLHEYMSIDNDVFLFYY